MKPDRPVPGSVETRAAPGGRRPDASTAADCAA